MKKFISVLLLLLFTLPVFGKNSILIIGDSLSAGHGIDPSQGWVALLRNRLQEKHFDYTVVNASISGDTTQQGLDRLPAALQEAQPEITIIELGGNDGLRGLPISVITQNLQQMITLIKKANSQVVLIGLRLPPNYGAAYTQEFHQIFAELAQKNQINLVAYFLKNIDQNPNKLQPDHIHPTTEAQPILLNNVWPTLEPLLKH